MEYLDSSKTIIFLPMEKKNMFDEKISQGSVFPRLEYFEDFSLKEFVKKIDYLINVEKITIDSISTQCEESIIDVGFLNDYYTKKNSEYLINTCFRDKYIMRCLLQNIVKQPDFYLINSEDDIKKFMDKYPGNNFIIKHRFGCGSRSIKKVSEGSKVDFSDFKDNLFSGNYIIENYVTDSIMVSNDGYAINSKIKRFFVHDYDKPVFDALSDKSNHIVKTSSFYENNRKLIEIMKIRCQSIFDRFEFIENISPFHIEWFVNLETNEVTLCEVARRYGGAGIPALIRQAFDVDILKEYWNIINFGTDNSTKNNIMLPTRIAASFQANAEEGILVAKPEPEDFNWAHMYYSFFELNTEINIIPEETKPISFYVDFSCNSIDDFREKIKLLNNLARQYVYDHSKSEKF